MVAVKERHVVGFFGLVQFGAIDATSEWFDSSVKADGRSLMMVLMGSK